MRYTFKPDDCMVISIPLGNLKNVRDGQLMPEKFTCIFKDAYKVFLKGRPKELGAAQLCIGVFVICIGSLITLEYGPSHLVYTLPSALFIASGILTFAAGNSPVMPVVKLSFVFNIISLFWSITAIVLCPILQEGHPGPPNTPDASRKIKLAAVVKMGGRMRQGRISHPQPNPPNSRASVDLLELYRRPPTITHQSHGKLNDSRVWWRKEHKLVSRREYFSVSLIISAVFHKKIVPIKAIADLLCLSDTQQ
uniref:Si:ch211-269k10.5 n=1 Tax=Cyprinus carpio TaxID=7962 RepID=A0A8C1SCW9_CYPCA